MKLKIKLSYEEMEAIRFVSTRYTSGELLYDGLKMLDPDKDFEDPYADGEMEYTIEEQVVCEIYRAIPEDGGSYDAMRRMIPCLGGTLAPKIALLFTQVWSNYTYGDD